MAARCGNEVYPSTLPPGPCDSGGLPAERAAPVFGYSESPPERARWRRLRKGLEVAQGAGRDPPAPAEVSHRTKPKVELGGSEVEPKVELGEVVAPDSALEDYSKGEMGKAVVLNTVPEDCPMEAENARNLSPGQVCRRPDCCDAWRSI